MPVPSKTAAKKAAPRKAAAKKAPAKKITARKAPAKKAAPKVEPEMIEGVPVPPWVDWDLPPLEDRDEWTYYGPKPDSPEMIAANEYIGKYRNTPGYEAMIKKYPISVGHVKKTATEQTSAEIADMLLQQETGPSLDPSNPLVYVQPDEDSMYAIIQDTMRRYQSEPPRLYVIVREMQRKSLVLATDLYMRDPAQANWVDDLMDVKIFGAMQAADQLVRLSRQAQSEAYEATYTMLPLDQLIVQHQHQKMGADASMAFTGGSFAKATDEVGPVIRLTDLRKTVEKQLRLRNELAKLGDQVVSATGTDGKINVQLSPELLADRL